MEPVLLVCGGCGVRIRTRHPEVARSRNCPRCDSPLAPAVDQALGILSTQDDLGLPPLPTRARRLTTASLAIIVTLGSLASLAVREASPGSEPPDLTIRERSALVVPVTRRAARSAETPATAAPLILGNPSEIDEIPNLSASRGQPSRDLAILHIDRRDPILPPPAREAGPRTDSLGGAPPPPPHPEETPDPKSTPTPPGRSTRASTIARTRCPRAFDRGQGIRDVQGSAGGYSA